jgi:predicted DNA binding CopG/RHH family protein
MSAKSRTELTLPPGLSPAEEARWWDEHDDFWDTLDTSDEVVASQTVRRTKPVTLRLPVEMIAQLKVEAAKHSLPYQTLVRMWLKERLDAEASGRRKHASA